MVTASGGDGEPADATCPKQAPYAIGGGGSVEDKGGLLEVSAPITKGNLSSNGQRPGGWRVKASAGKYTAYAICASAGASESSEEEEEESSEKKAAELQKEAELGK